MILKIFALALIGAFLGFTVKAFGWKGAPLVAVGAFVSILTLVGAELEKIRQIFDTVSGIDGMKEATETLLKVLFVGYLSGICIDVCRELGEATIASAVHLAARLEVLVIVSPYLLEILNLGLELVQ